MLTLVSFVFRVRFRYPRSSLTSDWYPSSNASFLL
jgi:hypothetical protein